MLRILHISIYGAKTEAATSTTIASLERASFALSFDTYNSIFIFCVEMYLFPEQVTYVYYGMTMCTFNIQIINYRITNGISSHHKLLLFLSSLSLYLSPSSSSFSSSSSSMSPSSSPSSYSSCPSSSSSSSYSSISSTTSSSPFSSSSSSSYSSTSSSTSSSSPSSSPSSSSSCSSSSSS